MLSSGILSDKFGRRHVTMGGILLLALSSLGFIFVRSYELFLVLTFLAAVGESGTN